MQESHWSTSYKSFFFYLCRALNKYNCGQNLLTSTLGLVEQKEQHLILNCSRMSGMNHRSFHWQCTGRCWSSTQCWNQLREAQTLNVLWLCWDRATRRMFFIPLPPPGGLISLVIYKSPTILHSEYTAGALCQPPMHDMGDWKKVWLSGAGVGGLQGRVQFLKHLSALTFLYQVPRHSCM